MLGDPIFRQTHAESKTTWHVQQSQVTMWLLPTPDWISGQKLDFQALWATCNASNSGRSCSQKSSSWGWWEESLHPGSGWTHRQRSSSVGCVRAEFDPNSGWNLGFAWICQSRNILEPIKRPLATSFNVCGVRNGYGKMKEPSSTHPGNSGWNSESADFWANLRVVSVRRFPQAQPLPPGRILHQRHQPACPSNSSRLHRRSRESRLLTGWLDLGFLGSEDESITEHQIISHWYHHSLMVL